MVFKAVIFDSSGVTLSFQKIPFAVELFAELKKDPEGWKVMENLELGIGYGEQSNFLFEKTLDANPHLKEAVHKAMRDETYFSIFDNMVEDPYVSAALPRLMENGIKTCLLTNNIYKKQGRPEIYAPCDVLNKFDVNVISCRDHCRKPNKDAFDLACKRMGVQLTECVFIDDFPENCNGARNLGIKTIEVCGTDTKKAIKELQEVMGIELL